jgi:hypothetical protein
VATLRADAFFHFDLDEADFARRLVKHVVLDTDFARVGFSNLNLEIVSACPFRKSYPDVSVM